MSYYDDLVRRINKGKITINDIEEINREKGYHFFDRDTMNFFRSRVERDALQFGQLIDGKYFVTSEQFDRSSPRLYSVRSFNSGTGNVDTVGDFQEFGTKGQAKKFAWCMANENDVDKCRGIIK